MRRRKFLMSTLAGGALLGGADGMTVQSSAQVKGSRQEVRLQDTGKYEILLKGGHVIDPSNSINSKMDVAVSDGKIASVGRNIPAGDARKTIDVSDLYVTPGLIDIHGHFCGDSMVIADHHGFNSGVTTVVDAGTTGADNFEDFKKNIENSHVRTLAFLNISKLGMPGNNLIHTFDVKSAVETAKKYPDIIVGFKSVRYSYWEREDLGIPQTPAWASVDRIEEAGRLAGLPCMFHFDPEPDHRDWKGASQHEFLLEKTRPGDIYTHCFRRKHPIILDDGRLNPDFVNGQKRGVIFDVGHGQNSFVWRNVVTAIEQGFLPDSISTDIHTGNVNGPVINMINVMSKFLNIGMSLEDVIRCSTVNPARAINRSESGTLSVGASADIAVMEMVRGKFTFLDIHCDGNGGKIDADKKLEPIMTLFNGEIVFDPYGLSYLYWENIPVENDYWLTHRTGLKLAPKEAYIKQK